MRLSSFLAAAVLLSASLIARADPTTTFYLNSTFVEFPLQSSGGTITGTLTLDTTLNDFTSVDLTASGFPNPAEDTTFTSFNAGGNGSGGLSFGLLSLSVAAGAGGDLNLYLMGTTTLAGYTGSGICSQTSSPSCYISDLSAYLPSGGGAFVAESGTIEPETVAPTPEPASVLLLATGLLGLAAIPRRRLA